MDTASVITFFGYGPESWILSAKLTYKKPLALCNAIIEHILHVLYHNKASALVSSKHRKLTQGEHNE